MAKEIYNKHDPAHLKSLQERQNRENEEYNRLFKMIHNGMAGALRLLARSAHREHLSTEDRNAILARLGQIDEGARALLGTTVAGMLSTAKDISVEETMRWLEINAAMAKKAITSRRARVVQLKSKMRR